MKYETVEPIDAKLNVWKVKSQCGQFVTLSTFVEISQEAKSGQYKAQKLFLAECK